MEGGGERRRNEARSREKDQRVDEKGTTRGMVGGRGETCGEVRWEEGRVTLASRS